MPLFAGLSTGYQISTFDVFGSPIEYSDEITLDTSAFTLAKFRDGAVVLNEDLVVNTLTDININTNFDILLD